MMKHYQGPPCGECGTRFPDPHGEGCAYQAYLDEFYRTDTPLKPLTAEDFMAAIRALEGRDEL